MKKIIVLSFACFCFVSLFAQQNNDAKNNDYGELKGGFKQQNIFVGGGLNIGGGSGSFSIGASPEAGYSFNQWLDAGIGVNLIYTSVAANTYYNPTNVKYRQFNYGGGPFIRVYPLKFLFIQGQFEENWTKQKQKDDIYSEKQTFKASSLIAGVGYTQRSVGQGSYYIMVGLDLLKNPYSPYVTENSSGQLVAAPIVRVGFNFYLRPSKAAMRESRSQSARIL